MHTELPTLVNVCETDYNLQCSESYTGTIHQETTIKGYQYCTSLDRAFQSLTSKDFKKFCLGNRMYCSCLSIAKVMCIYDSHARDILMVEAILKVQMCCLKYHH